VRRSSSLLGLGFATSVLAWVSLAGAQQAVPDEPIDDQPVEEQGPPPPKEPEQEPLVERPRSKAHPRPVNALPIVSTDAPPALIWKWPRFSAADWVITAGGAAVTLSTAIVKPRAQHSLTGPLGFDSNVREALRADRLETRYRFRDFSDVGLSLSVSWPFVSDALVTAWWYRGSREAAQEMALIDLQTLAVIGALQGTTNVIVSRERPFGRGCGQGELPGDAIDCVNSFHYRSFFSGHAAFSFTGAALICVHHVENDLLGGPWDALSCAGGYAVAATTATLRVVADVHYASDVLLGATLGTLVGYTVPLLHYRKLGGGSRAVDGSASQLRINLVPSPGGIGLSGVF
jgi:membrane-associated phospholipid phosphatase